MREYLNNIDLCIKYSMVLTINFFVLKIKFYVTTFAKFKNIRHQSSIQIAR
ncbi:hypothetical protein RCH18_001255 [Flavobacterium sp. PL11]|nr:hypothetical protein [Flavobacterium sp. PL11]